MDYEAYIEEKVPKGRLVMPVGVCFKSMNVYEFARKNFMRSDVSRILSTVNVDALTGDNLMLHLEDDQLEALKKLRDATMVKSPLLFCYRSDMMAFILDTRTLTVHTKMQPESFVRSYTVGLAPSDSPRVWDLVAIEAAMELQETSGNNVGLARYRGDRMVPYTLHDNPEVDMGYVWTGPEPYSDVVVSREDFRENFNVVFTPAQLKELKKEAA